jgi:hypothetical protein
MALGDFRAVFLPYCVERQPDGRYAVLNREYKPVGFHTREHVEYASYPVLVKLKGLTPARAAKISHAGSRDVERIFLYDDGSNPVRSAANMKAYMARLAVLARLEIVRR